MEAVAASLEHLDLVIDAFGDTVGDAVFKVTEDAVSPAGEPFGQPDERFQSALLAALDPAFEECLGFIASGELLWQLGF